MKKKKREENYQLEKGYYTSCCVLCACACFCYLIIKMCSDHCRIKIMGRWNNSSDGQMATHTNAPLPLPLPVLSYSNFEKINLFLYKLQLQSKKDQLEPNSKVKCEVRTWYLWKVSKLTQNGCITMRREIITEKTSEKKKAKWRIQERVVD